jgi:tRNA uridine 5-carboxymethylaminomethyl modification enzyme
MPEVIKFMQENGFDKEGVEQVMIQIKYSGYINREKENAEKLTRLDYVQIPGDFQYNKLASLSSEAKQKLTTLQPKTIAHASRISGVSPADISVLLVYMGR